MKPRLAVKDFRFLTPLRFVRNDSCGGMFEVTLEVVR